MSSPFVSVRSFGATGNGVNNDSPAFQAAVNSFPAGSVARIHVPAGHYELTQVIANNGRTPIFICEPGATFTAADPETRFQWPARVERWLGRVRVGQTVHNGATREGGAMHDYTLVRNIGGPGSVGYARRFDYASNSYGVGFDIADGIIAQWDRTSGQDGGQQLTQWLVAASPEVGGSSTKWCTFVAEWNVVNRHTDHGWSKRRSTLPNWAGIFQVVPEANTLGMPGAAHDVLFGIVLTRSAGNKAGDGMPARMHNAILVEPDSVTPAGRAIYMSGRSALAADQTPVAALELDDAWQRGINTRRATMTSGVAVGLGASHAVAWLDSNDAPTNGIYSGTGSPEGVVTAGVGSLYTRRDGGAGSTLYVKESGTGNTGWVAK